MIANPESTGCTDMGDRRARRPSPVLRMGAAAAVMLALVGGTAEGSDDHASPARSSQRPDRMQHAPGGERATSESAVNIARESWPDERYTEALRGSRYARFAGGGARPPLLDPEKREDRAIHEAIVRDVQERRDLHRARSTATAGDGDFIQQRTRFLDDRIDRFVDQLYGLSRGAVASIKKALGEDVRDDAPPPEDVVDMTSDALWSRLDAPDRGEAWADALAELTEREDPALSSYVIAHLQALDVSVAARNALIFAAERTQCYDPRARASLKDTLLTHAVAMRDAGEQQPLWAAIRRYASLVPTVQADGLLQFLRGEDEPMTRHVALQGIESIFSVDVAEDCPAVSRLRERVHRLSTELLAAAGEAESGGNAFAVQAFCAAAALVDPELPALADRLAALQRRYPVARAVKLVRSVDALWDRAGEGIAREGARATLAETIARLERRTS